MPETRLDTYLAIAKSRQELPSALFDDGTAEFRILKPTLFVFTSDWHLGAVGTDYNQFEQDTDHLASARGVLKDQLRILANGDFIDGYLPQGTPKNPFQVLDPVEQRAAAIKAFELIQPDWYCEGDHDMWHSQTMIQHSWLYDHAKSVGRPYVQWGGKLEVRTEKGTEKWLVRHRYPGSRAGHPTGPHKKLVSELGPARVAALAHTHSYPGVHKAWSQRREEGPFHAVQSGTYKIFDDYGKKIGAYEGEYGVPAVLIEPNGTITGYDKYEDGLNRLL